MIFFASLNRKPFVGSSPTNKIFCCVWKMANLRAVRMPRLTEMMLFACALRERRSGEGISCEVSDVGVKRKRVFYV